MCKHDWSVYLDLTTNCKTFSPILIHNTFSVFFLLLHVNNSIGHKKLTKVLENVLTLTFWWGEKQNITNMPVEYVEYITYVSLSGRNMSLSASGQLWQYYIKLAGIYILCMSICIIHGWLPIKEHKYFEDNFNQHTVWMKLRNTFLLIWISTFILSTIKL